jgi:small neutral amino acid transporter SnatA (MarC family)
MTPSFQEVVLILFVGMGPVKVIVYYLASIHDATPALARRVAVLAVGTATLTALGLLVIGALLFRLLHFSEPALVVASGIVLLAYGIEVILRAEPASRRHPPPDESELMRRAIFPMGVPLILNPAGIAATTIFSAEATGLDQLGVLVAIVLGIALLDLVVLVVARPIGPRLPAEATLVLEQLLGVLLVAVAVELVVIGLTQYGILDVPLLR